MCLVNVLQTVAYATTILSEEDIAMFEYQQPKSNISKWVIGILTAVVCGGYALHALNVF